MRALLFVSLIYSVALCGFAETIHYTYDSAGRLMGADYGASGAISYSYDSAGNLITRQVHSAATVGAPEIQSVLNGASFVAGSGIAPGELISVFATNLGSKDQSSGFPSTNFQGISVLFNGKPVPLLGLFGSQNQVNLVVPTDLGVSGSVSIQVQNGAGASAAKQVSLAASDVGIFIVGDPKNASRKNAAIRFAGTAWFVMPTSTATAFGVPSCSGLAVTATCGQPAGAGDAVEIYLTGLGKATPNADPNGTMLPTGQLAPANGNPVYSSVTKPTVTVGGVTAELLFAGLAPGTTGFYQVNVRIPAGVSAGDDVPLTVAVPGGTSNTASIAIHP